MAIFNTKINGVALVAAAAKTVLELGTAATSRAKIKQWWVEFDGTSSSAVPVLVEFQRASAGVTTATTITAGKNDAADGAAATVVKHTTTVEGAGTLSDGETHLVPPTGGLVMQYLPGTEYVVAVSSFWRIRCTAPAGVNVTCGVVWDE